MKSKIIFVLVVLLALFSESCKENITINSDELIGIWQSEKIEFNGTPLSGDFNWVNDSRTLEIAKETLYFKNQVGGNWELEDKDLTLTPIDDLNLPPRTFKLISVSEKTLVLEIELTEVEYCCDLEEFEREEKLRITEHYVRIN